MRYRLWVLGAAVLGPATVSQLTYAGALASDAPAAQLRAATVMYYGGDVVELALAVSTLWGRPALRRTPSGRSRRLRRISDATQSEVAAWT